MEEEDVPVVFEDVVTLTGLYLQVIQSSFRGKIERLDRCLPAGLYVQVHVLLYSRRICQAPGAIFRNNRLPLSFAVAVCSICFSCFPLERLANNDGCGV